MTSTSFRRRALQTAGAAAVALGVALAVPVATVHADGRQLVVLDERGEAVVTEDLPPSGQFSLEYQHSYYDQPATERFVAAATGFRVASLSSPSEPVLDYYDVAGTRSTTADGEHVLVPHTPAELDVLPLIATQKGQRTLVVGGRRTPLWAADGASRHLRLRVVEHSRLSRLLPFL